VASPFPAAGISFLSSGDMVWDILTTASISESQRLSSKDNGWPKSDETRLENFDNADAFLAALVCS
jgi:hypothetical protein